MARLSAANAPNGALRRSPRRSQAPLANGTKSGGDEKTDEKTDYTRWRMLDDNGRQTWHYLESDEEVKKWPQNVADKYYLGLATGLPNLKPAKTPLQAAENGFSFFSKLQLDPGNWACEYGGPLFLLPGLVITWYVTETPIPRTHSIEIKNYLFARQRKDGGWGLHIEGLSSVFGTAMNYTVLRILGVSPEDPRMVKARGLLHQMGGATNGPHWAKFWLSVLGVCQWDIVNPVPPELWLFPDWVPIAPWRWWIHIRQVFLPMSFIGSKRWAYPPTDLTIELRKELLVQPYESINFVSHRNDIHPRDNYNPRSWILNLIYFIIVNIWTPWILPLTGLTSKAQAWTWKLIQMEDANTDYSNLGPVNGPMNLLACYIQEGPDAYSVRRHRERMADFLWMKDEGMLMNGTNGVQNWDTSFAIQAALECGFEKSDRWKPVLVKALKYLEAQQRLENVPDHEKCYRYPTKGAWGFSNKDQGYTVSDTTSEAVKAVMLLQAIPDYPKLVSDERVKWAIDLILGYQNRSGGVSSYEPSRGSELLEYLNAAEVFGRIMVEYDYPECTTACITALQIFSQFYPDYRQYDIQRFLDRAIAYIKRAQRPDGSWYGAWGICFTYAGMFALESLRLSGETCANSERCQRACKFFVDRQFEDGGWGESYRSCEEGVWIPHDESQVVNTAWACIGLMEADYPDREPIEKGIKLIMERQQANGEWLQEAIEGVFNKSCMISYPNYKFEFTTKALGMFARKYGDFELL